MSEYLTEAQILVKLADIDEKIDARVAGNLLVRESWSGGDAARDTQTESVEELTRLREFWSARLDVVRAKSRGVGTMRSIVKMRRPGR